MWKWLRSPDVTLWQVPLLILAVMILYPAWCLIYYYFIYDLLPSWMSLQNSHKFLFDSTHTPISIRILYHIPFGGPAFENLIFLALPLDIALRRLGRWGVFTVVLIAVFVFAYFHGGMPRVPLQGVAGLMFAYLYLKCGGRNGLFLAPLLITTVAHEGANQMVGLLFD